MKNELVKSTVPGLPIHIGGGPWVLQKPNSCPFHYHDEIEILAGIEGTKRVFVDGKEYLLGAGDVIFINSRVPHCTTDEVGPNHMILLQFRSDAFFDMPSDKLLRHLARFANNTGEHPVHFFPADGDGEFYRYILQLYEENREKSISYEIYVRGCVYLILGYLYRTGIMTDVGHYLDSRSVDKVLPALAYIDEHYPEEISLLDLSILCGLSEGYFCRQFKEATGSTFVEYLNFVRIYNAEKLLRKTDKPILDISMDVGFSTVSYFNRTFRKFKSCSPRSYRNAQYLREQ